MKFLPFLALVLLVSGGLAAKLENVVRARQLQPSNNFPQGDFSQLFGGSNGYLPPNRECVPEVVTSTVRLPAQTVTISAQPLVPRTVTITDQYSVPPQTVTTTEAIYVTEEVPRYTTITSTSVSISRTTQVVPTTISRTQTSTVDRTVVNTVYETKYNTVFDTITLPPLTQYITTTIQPRPIIQTTTNLIYSTITQYSTQYSTQTQFSTFTVTSTSTSFRVQPTTIVDYSTIINVETDYITSTVVNTLPGIVSTITERAVTKTVDPVISTVYEPCGATTTTRRGYQYTTPAASFNPFG